MTISFTALQAIAQLAYLETNPEDIEKLAEEINSIIDFVQHLSEIDTSDVAPLFHPMDIHQPLRPDVISEDDCSIKLAEIAPCFEEKLYLVPKVIDTEK